MASTSVVADSPGTTLAASTAAHHCGNVVTAFHPVEILAGGIAGVSEHVATFPFDTVKTRMQDNPTKYPTIRTTIRHIIQNEGRAAHFFRGCTPVLASAFPAHAAYFSFYEAAKRTMGADSSIQYATCAIFAAIGHDAVSVPFDVLKQHMQCDGVRKYSSTWHCFRELVCPHGSFVPSNVSRLFTAFPTTVAMNVPHMATHWIVYEAMKKKLGVGADLEETVNWKFLTAGFTAGAVAAAASTPWDVVKTQLQLHKATSIQTAVRLVYTERGMHGFVTGILPRVFFMAPSAAVVMTTYEATKMFLSRP